MNRDRVGHGALAWILCSVAGATSSCAGCGEVDLAAARELVSSQPSRSPFLRAQGRVRIESPKFSGEFLAVLLARAEPLAIRLQLFPDIGGKVLDLAVSDSEQHGVIPPTNQALSYPDGSGDRLLEMFATSVLEIHTRIEPGRITCLRRAEPESVTMELEPRYGATRCVLHVGPDWGNRVYEITRRGVSWRMRVEGERKVEIRSKRFALWADITDRETPTSVPSNLFHLSNR